MVSKPPRRIAIVLALIVMAMIAGLATAPAQLSAQQAPGDVPAITIRANTRLVVVDVVVTDKKGKAVTSMQPGDFTLEENGKKQKISIFVPPGAANRVAPSVAPAGVLSNHPENVGPAGVPWCCFWTRPTPLSRIRPTRVPRC